MWGFMIFQTKIIAFLSIFIVLGMMIIRKNNFLRIYLQSKLYFIGIQINNNIYTPVCDIYSDNSCFDIVYIKKHQSHICCYNILRNQSYKILLSYVPPNYRLEHRINDEVQQHIYLEGTPFNVTEGKLILFEKKRKGLGFIFQKHSESTSWPTNF